MVKKRVNLRTIDREIYDYKKRREFNSKNSNLFRVRAEMEKERKSTEESKNAAKLAREIEKQEIDFIRKKPNARPNETMMAVDRGLIERYGKAVDLAESKRIEISKKYVDKFSTATLQDLGYSVTSGNRKKLNKFWSYWNFERMLY